MTQTTPVTAAATFCATLVDEWLRAGVSQAVICPGSRSTPLALALAESSLDVHVHHDERSAAFVALGIGLATGVPAVLLTTSGTAAAELHPAVVEADLAGVPMVVCTADRPPELQDVGAPQTIDQTHLFGRSVRWFTAPEVPDDSRVASWRPLAARSVVEATGAYPGPVHLNLAFRDPLVGQPGELPAGRDDGRPWVRDASGSDLSDHAGLHQAASALQVGRGVILAGGRFGGPPAAVAAIAHLLAWPVLASPRATGLWGPGDGVVTHADALLRVPAVAADRPDVVLRVGENPASRVINEWLGGVPVVAAVGAGRWVDPSGQMVAIIPEASIGSLRALLGEGGGADPAWRQGWLAAESAARGAIAALLDGHDEPTEPAVARDVVAALPDGAALVVSSSMPIRDVEWYARPRDGLQVLANRGANGIDGVVSTAIGVAGSTGGPTAVLVGDVAFLHDSNALLGLAARNLNLTIVVVDNDGGGIFSFLPQGSQLRAERFEQLFGTPHGVDLGKLVEAHGIPCVVLESQAEVGPAVAEAAARSGPRVLIVRTDRAANVAVHDEIHAAVAAALGPAQTVGFPES